MDLRGDRNIKLPDQRPTNSPEQNRLRVARTKHAPKAKLNEKKHRACPPQEGRLVADVI